MAVLHASCLTGAVQHDWAAPPGEAVRSLEREAVVSVCCLEIAHLYIKKRHRIALSSRERDLN